MKTIALIDKDGVVQELEPRNEKSQIRMMFNCMLHYSQSNSINGRKIRMIIFDCFSTDDEIKINSLRKQFNKNEYLSDRQFDMLLRYYRTVLADLAQ